jgi:hypothetical protein
VFRTTDGGLNWVAVNSGLATLTVNTVVVDPQNPRMMYAGTAAGLFAINLDP